MNMDQIRCVLIVARCGSFTEASFQSNLSQSSISKKIASLEKELGVALFDRTTRTVRATLAGEEFVRHGREILHQYNLLRKGMRSYARPRDRLVVGSIYFAPDQGLASCIAKFTTEYPAIEIETVYDTTSPLMEGLLGGDIDVAIVSSMYPSDCIGSPPNFAADSRFVSSSLDVSPYYLVVGERHPLAGRKVVDYRDLRGEKLITLDKNMDVYHKAVDGVFEKEGFRPDIVVQSGSIQEALVLVSKNIGVAIFSPKVASGFEGVRLIELRRPLLRDTQIVVRDTRRISDSVRLFYEYVKLNYR